MAHVTHPFSHPIETENQPLPQKHHKDLPQIISFGRARRALAKHGLLPRRRRVFGQPTIIQFDYACRMLAKKTALFHGRYVRHQPFIISRERISQLLTRNRSQRAYSPPAIIHYPYEQAA
jgi:hypothetical protein